MSQLLKEAFLRDGVPEADLEKEIGLWELSERALELAMARYGPDNLSDDHVGSLTAVASQLSHMADAPVGPEAEAQHIGIDLQTGAGKTLMAKSWMAAVHELDRPYAVALAATEIEALCQIKRELIKDFGIPEAKIGLLHTDPKASEPSDPVEALPKKQFLLLTHNMVRTGQRNLDTFWKYQDRARDLLIYDETLLYSEALYLKVQDVNGAAIDVGASAKTRSELVPLARFLAACRDAIEVKPSVVVALPELKDFGLDPDANWHRASDRYSDVIRALIKEAGSAVRMMPSGHNVVIGFKEKISDEIKSIVSLDASYPIRYLAHLGGLEIVEKRQGNIDYSPLTIEHFAWNSGRGSIKRECKQELKDRRLVRGLADWINEQPANEKVLIWTFKARDGVDIPEELRRGLRYHGISEGRYEIATHGSLKGSNTHKDISRIAFYGVFYPSPPVVGGLMLGQYRNHAADLDGLEEAYTGEVVHELYQEISRCSVRKIGNGKAGQATVLLPIGRHYGEILTRLYGEDAFNNCRPIHRVDLRKACAGELSKTEQVAEAVLQYLAKQHPDITQLSTRQIMDEAAKAADFEVTEHMRKDASALLTDKTRWAAMELLSYGWIRHSNPKKRSFIRAYILANEEDED